MKQKGTTILVLTISILLSLSMFLSAKEPKRRVKEPKRPTIDHAFGAKQEAKIKKLKSLSLQGAFARLKSVDFFVNDDLLNKATFNAFTNRRTDAIALAMQHLRLPIIETIEGKLVSRNEDFHVAKKILHVFPDEAVDSLLILYSQTSDAVTKANIIRASGKLAGGQVIRDLLVNALDNKSFCEDEDPEMSAAPLRICDVAYNQLVLRYKVRNVLRTIGPVHRIEVRDYHIDILRDLL